VQNVNVSHIATAIQLSALSTVAVLIWGTSHSAVLNDALIFSERELTFTFVICYRPSVYRLSSVTFVRPTQAVQIFDNISTALGTLAIR